MVFVKVVKTGWHALHQQDKETIPHRLHTRQTIPHRLCTGLVMVQDLKQSAEWKDQPIESQLIHKADFYLGE